MDPNVRRVNRAVTRVSPNQSAIQPDEVVLPAVERRKDGLLVTSQTSLGVDPRVYLQWNVDSEYWLQGYRLLGFRSPRGFAPDAHTSLLQMHGEMFLEETENGSREERLPEGTHYFTFVLHKKTFWKESMSVVRFSESIPSARTAISRIEDQLRLQKLQQDHSVAELNRQIEMNNAIVALHRSSAKLEELTKPKPDDSLEAQVRREVEAVVRKKLKKAMTRVELIVALQDVQKQLRRSPSWKKMDALKRERMLQKVVEDLDDDEELFE